MKKLFTLLMLAVTLISTAQESTLLRLKYKKGEKYLMKMTMNQNMGDGMMLMNMGMNMNIDVKDVKADVYDVEMSIAKMTMEMKGGGMDVKFDSDAKDEDLDEQGKMMKAQVAPALEIVVGAKMNSLGKTSDIKIIKGPQGNLEQFEQANSSVTYPEKAVSVGTTWTEEKTNKGMVLKYTYKVTSITKSSVILDVTGDITGQATGTFTGKMDINRSNGVPEKGNIDMDMQVMGQNAKMKINFTSEKM